MRKTSFLVLFFLCSLAVTAQNNIDVLHYRYDIELNDNNDTIRGWATIRFMAREKTKLVNFDLKNIDKGKGMRVTQLSFGFRSSVSPAYTHQQDKLAIQWSRDLNKGDTASIHIFYEGIPADGLIISKNKYGRRTFFADNWPDRGRNWLPCVEDPADKATLEFIVTAPQHYQVVSNGIQLEETNLPANKKRTHWREDVPLSTKVMVIGVAEFAVNLSGMINGCIPVYSWVYPEDRDKGFYDYAQAADILPYFIKNVGPYGYKKLANVESKTIFGGLENANTIFYSEKSINGMRKSEGLLAHEIAHQWFGNMATEKTFAHLWLSEGFATYMTILYLENKYGTDTARAMLLEDRDQVIDFSEKNNSPVVDNNPDYMELLNPNSYQKGGWVLHMLRRQLGDSIFWKGIRTYYATYAGGVAGTDDLRKIFENISRKDLKVFFQQWLYTPGQPELAISWKYDSNAKKLQLTVKQEKGKFDFPFEIGIKDKSGKLAISKFNINQSTMSFTIPAKEKPVMIIADPNVSLLFNGKVTENR